MLPKENTYLSESKNFIKVLTVFAAFILTIQYYFAAGSELFLDEVVTWWVSKRGFYNAVFNTSPFAPHPLTYGLESLIINNFGDSPYTIRFCGLIFLIISLPLVLRIIIHVSEKALDSSRLNIALSMATLTYLVSLSANPEVFHARPYQMSNLLTLFCIDQTYEFCKNKKIKSLFLLMGAAFGAVINQPVYICYYYSLVPLLIITLNKTSRSWVANTKLCFCLLVSSILGASVSYFIGVNTIIYDLKSAYSFMPGINFDLIVQITLENSYLLIPLMLLLLIQRTRGKLNLSYPKYTGLLLWIITAPLGLIFISYVFKTNVILPRYLQFSQIIWVIISGVLCIEILNSFKLITYIKTIVIYFTIVSIGTFLLTKPFPVLIEGWLETARCVKESVHTDKYLTVLYPGHPQALISQNSQTKQSFDAWISPAMYFQIGDKEATELLAFDDNNQLEERLTKSILLAIEDSKTIVLFERGAIPEVVFNFEEILSQNGYFRNMVCQTNGVGAILYKNQIRSENF